MSNRTVVVGQRKITLRPKDLLGQGGEACVYRHHDLALKLYHPLPPAELSRRIQKLRDFPSGLPSEVLGPESLVSDVAGAPIGFAMRAIDGAEDLRSLALPRFREGRIGNQAVLLLFRRIRAILAALHDKQVVVGDLNDGNLVFTHNAQQPWLVDADSMQFGAHRCTVAHERFLDPRLYGIDLTGPQARFDAGTDWYAFAVLLFASLLYVHPFGGIHPRHPTPLRRAEARHSVLRGDVTLPKSATPFSVLPDPLIEWLRQQLELDRRDDPPLESMLGFNFVRCSCGLEHARRICPRCAIRVAMPEPVLRRGRVHAVRIRQTRGAILASAARNGLQYLCFEEGRFLREDGSRVELPPELSAKLQELSFVLTPHSTWVGHRRALLELRDGKPPRTAFTSTFGAQPMFDVGKTGLLVIDGEFLTEADTQLRLGSVFEGQTWFRAGEQLGYGFYRAGKLTLHWLFEPGRAGLTPIELPSIAGKLIETHAVFDEQHALITLISEDQGVEQAQVHLLRKDGTVLAHKSGPPASSVILRSPRNKALFGGRVLCATDRGLMSLQIDQRELVEGELFTDSEPFSSEDAELHAGPGGSVYVVRPKEIVQLSLR